MSGPAVIHRSGWPWPLDSVQGWFEGLWTGIQGWIHDAVSAITGFVTGAVRIVKTWIDPVAIWIGSAVTSISNFVVDALGGVATWITDAATSTVNYLHDHMMAVGTWISEGLTWTLNTLKGGLDAIVATLSGVAGDLGSAVAGFGSWIAESVQGSLGWLSNTIWGWIDGALSWASDTFRWLHAELMAGIGSVVGSVKGTVEGALSGIAGALSGIFDGFLGAFGSFNLGAAMAQTTGLLDVINTTYVQGLTAHSPLTPEEAHDLTHEWMWKQRDHWYTTYLMALGIEGASLGQVDAPIHMLLQEPQLASSLKLAEEWFAAPYTFGYSERLKQYWYSKYTPLIPPAVDLIRFVVREVITPARFYEIMPFLGFGSEWSAAYWEAHFILPAPAVLYDAFHRKKISAEELNKYIFWHDYKTTPRPGIAVSDVEIMRSTLKTLIPRVDLRYAWEIGQLSDEELVERYETLGYEDDAELMAGIQKVRALTEEIGKVRTAWLADLQDGFISDEVARANLKTLGHSDLRIDYYISYASLRRERALTKDLLGIYRTNYFKDLLTPEDFEARIYELIAIPKVAEMFIEKAYASKYAKPKPPQKTDESAALKEANKYRVSYARELYRRYAIEKNDFITFLIAAGVDPGVAAARADYEELRLPVPKPLAEVIARRKEEAKLQDLKVRSVVEEYRRFIIDEDVLLSRLTEAGISDVLATARMQLEKIRRPAPAIPAEEIERRRVVSRVLALRSKALVAYYRSYSIDEEGLVGGLVLAGLDPAEAAAMVEYEEARRPRPKPSVEEVEALREERRIQKLAEVEALTLFRGQAITGDELRERLRALDYSEDLVEAIARLEEIKLALKMETS